MRRLILLKKKFEHKYSVNDGDLLFSWAASLGVYIWDRGDAWLNQHIFKVVPKEFLNKKYLFYSLESTIQGFYAQTHGSGMVHITKRKFEATSFTLPPLQIQKSIVKKIEELFSSLDSGIADLKKAQDQLVIYRQAVLKKAFEGELTKEWREKQTNLPSAVELLEQIKEKRQKHYEKQLADWKQTVKIWEQDGKKERKPYKPNKLTSFQTIEGEDDVASKMEWGNLTLKSLKTYSIYGPRFSSKDYVEDGTAVLRTTDISENGKVDWVNTPKLPLDNYDYEKYKLIKNDLLITRTGSIGRISVFNDDKKAIPGAFLIHYRLISTINIWYVYYFLKSRRGQNHLIGHSSGIGRPNLNVPNIEKLIIPIPSFQEQHRIVHEIESRLSVCDKVEESIAESLEKAVALRQSILKKAFEGKLLSEEEIAKCKADAAYEPASVLLERIRKEKSSTKTSASKGKKKQK